MIQDWKQHQTSWKEKKKTDKQKRLKKILTKSINQFIKPKNSLRGSGFSSQPEFESRSGEKLFGPQAVRE